MTVVGGGFTTTRHDYTCTFRCDGITLTSAPTAPSSSTTLPCTLPPNASLGHLFGPCYAQVGVFMSESKLEGSARFHFGAGWARVEPSTGAHGGGTVLVVYGAGFNASLGYACAFQGTDPLDGGAVLLRTPAHVDSRTELLCMSPQWPSTAGMFATFLLEEAGVRVSRAAAGDAYFRFSDGGWSSATPTQGYAGAGGNLSVSGTGFNVAATDYRVKFSEGGTEVWSAACATLSGSALRCAIPEWVEGEAKTLLSLYQGADEVGKQGLPLHFTFLPFWTALSPSVGAITGAAVVTLRGRAFDQALDYECRFTAVQDPSLFVESSAAVVDPTTITCNTPGWPSVDQAVTLALRHTGGAALPFQGQGGASDRFHYAAIFTRIKT